MSNWGWATALSKYDWMDLHGSFAILDAKLSRAAGAYPPALLISQEFCGQMVYA